MSHQLTFWDTPNATSSPVKASGPTRSGSQAGPTIARFLRDHAHVNLSARQAKERMRKKAVSTAAMAFRFLQHFDEY